MDRRLSIIFNESPVKRVYVLRIGTFCDARSANRKSIDPVGMTCHTPSSRVLPFVNLFHRINSR